MWDGFYQEPRTGAGYRFLEKIVLIKVFAPHAVGIVEGIGGNSNHYEEAVNVPNGGAIPNLPPETIVEAPDVVNSMGVQPLPVGPLPPAVAELCRREAALVELVVDTALSGDREIALQALLLDPMVNDIDRARAILDDYLDTFARYLPQFAGR